MEIRPIEKHIGAEVVGIDVRTITDEAFSEMYKAFVENTVLLIRNQELTKDEFLEYSRRFGPLEPHASKKTRDAEHPELTVMIAEPAKMVSKDGEPILMRGEGWHTDTPYWEKPAKATQLYSIEIPNDGGDTLMASMYAAYDALPDDLKARIEGVKGRFCYRGKTGDRQGFLNKEDVPDPVVHDIVQVHPETGRKALYVNPVHGLDIVGLSEAESDQLLEELYSYMLQPGAEYRHVWQPGDILIWDNRSAIHSATGGYKQRREMWRVTIR